MELIYLKIYDQLGTCVIYTLITTFMSLFAFINTINNLCGFIFEGKKR